ncbi:MAG: CotH kinase family protein [Firmicutes bacterium]|nr:CotH kinase family protein [Bacillota bacterium]MBR6473609.1 CotH kinase family protein [Bacillota bacterium]
MKETVIRRVGALLLALALCFTMMPMSVYADEVQAPEVQAAEDQEGVFTTTAQLGHIEKYGNLVLDTDLAALTEAGFEYGDVVTVKFLDKEVDMPLVSDFSDVDEGEKLLKAVDEKAWLAINMGNFATTFGIAEKITNDDGTIYWQPYEGVTDPISIEISMKEKGGYLEEYIIRKLNYTDERSDYPDLSDAEFANFREVTTTGMGQGTLYRTSSPVNPIHKRNTIADNCLKDAGVTVVMNLADSQEEIASYEGFTESYYSTTDYICLNMGVDFAAEEFQTKLANGFKFFAENPGTYAIHCTEGKDRAGFVSAVTECFMGATYEEVCADYMTTFYNYYGVKSDEDRYSAICNGNIVKSLEKAFDVEVLSECDLQTEATEYLKQIGLTDEEIEALKANLAADHSGTQPAGEIEDPYAQVGFIEAYENGLLKLPEGLKEDDITQPKYGNGLLLNGTTAVLREKTEIVGEFDFNGNDVGRITFDGLSDKGITANVSVYLDDEENPRATFSLGSQMGKKEWANKGDKTFDVYDSHITGKHKVSLSFDFVKKSTGEALADDDEVSVLIRSIEFCESSIPVIYFNIDENQGSILAMNSSEDHSAECYGTVDIQVPNGFVSEYENESMGDKKGLVLEYIRGRGNSTWGSDKKPYKVKFEESVDLFGMGENKHWILLANRFDNSLIRNRMTYWLGAEFGLEFTPQCVPVEVVMNGEYYGSYLLCEQIRIAKSRVNINDLEKKKYQQETDPEKISGGYLISMSPYGDEDPDNMFQTSRGMSFFLESPSFEDYPRNETQMNYITGYIQKVEDAIFGKDFKDTEGNKYTEYLDIDAAAKYWWIQEFSENGDAYGSGSTYLYKKENAKDGTKGKLFWGPLWDFDFVAWGDLDYNVDPQETFDYTNMEWFAKMRTDHEFTEKLKEEWDKLDDLLTDITKEGGLLDQYYEQTKISRKYDFEKWGAYGGWDEEESQTVRTYEEEVDQLRDWIEKRHTWVSENLDQLTPRLLTVTFKVNGEVVGTQEVMEGYPIESFPEAPAAKKGYVFIGWYSEDYGIFVPGDCAYEDMELTPYYIKESEMVKPEKLYFGNYDPYVVLWGDYEEEYYPSYTIVPEYADIRTIEWSSSDPSVAEVDEYGNVICHKAGTAKITGKVGNVKNSYTIHVVKAEDEEINDPWLLEVNKNELNMIVGDYDQIVATVGPQPCWGWGTEITWISTDYDVAGVDNNGVVTAYSPGTTTLIAISPEMGMYQTVKVTVKALKSPKLSLTANVSKKQVKASWKAVKKATKYQVAYRKAGSSKWNYRPTTKTSLTIKNLKKGGIYQFKMRTIGKNTKSKWTSVQRIYMKKMTMKLKSGKKSVKVSWKKNSKAAYYEITWSYNSKMTKAKTIKVARGKTSYTIKNLKKGKRVYVKIRAMRKYKGKTYKGVLSARKSVKVK